MTVFNVGDIVHVREFNDYGRPGFARGSREMVALEVTDRGTLGSHDQTILWLVSATGMPVTTTTNDQFLDDVRPGGKVRVTRATLYTIDDV